jgi:hypothetical protein
VFFDWVGEVLVEESVEAFGIATLSVSPAAAFLMAHAHAVSSFVGLALSAPDFYGLLR